SPLLIPLAPHLAPRRLDGSQELLVNPVLPADALVIAEQPDVIVPLMINHSAFGAEIGEEKACRGLQKRREGSVMNPTARHRLAERRDGGGADARAGQVDLLEARQ